MVVRRHPESSAPVPDYLTWGLIPRDAETRPDIQPMNARAVLGAVMNNAFFGDGPSER